MKRMIFAALLVGALFLPASAWAINIVANPGFETGDFTSWTPSGNMNNMSVQTDNVHSGTYSAEFGEVTTLGYIDQTLTTVAGGNYTLSFWLQNGSSEGPSRFEVYWGGALLNGVSDMAAQGYIQQSYNVTASTTSTVLRFGFRQDPDWFHLDDVSVDSAVPEPGAFQLTLIGAAMIFAAGRFRRRRG